jgi:tripartite-type tricarboxylate transporter receptor subunit TctC
MTHSYARSLLRVVPFAVAVLAASGAAGAQDYPARPVRIVFPLAAGGGGDVFTRALADELQKAWHQPVVVENRPGGGQNIGARACVEAAPDGYTLCLMSSEPAVYNEFLYKTIPTVLKKICSRSQICFSTRCRSSSTARPRSRPSPA